MRAIKWIHTRSRANSRGAALYVVVLAVTLIVAVLGLAALTELQLQRESLEREDDMLAARRYAQAAVEIGLQRIADDADWRNTYLSGVWESSKPIGDGTYTIEGIDAGDGVLNDSDADSLVLRGTGVCGSATQKVEVTLSTVARGLTCLEVALHVGNNLTVYDPSTVNGSVIISANNNIQASGAVTIYPDCEAAGTTVGTIQPGSTTSGIAPREMPAADIFDYYQTNGTAISIISLPLVDSIRTIEQVVISAANNPYGAGLTNAEGVYVIDCQSQDLRIRNCRIVGTLLLLNVGSGSQIADSVNWSAAVANYPALLVDGPMAFDFTNAPLAESTISFNPTGTGYEGSEDSDVIDSYPSEIAGLVYVSGNATSNNHPVFDGVVVTGNSMDIFGDANFAYQSEFLDNPPPGFANYGKLKVGSGSWKQSID